jgi:sugar lactone lactonase YvrE
LSRRNQDLVGSLDRLSSREKRIRLDSTVPCSIPSFSPTGVIVAGISSQGSQSNQLSFPYGLYIDANNLVYVGDVGNDRIQLWTYGATAGITVAGGQGTGSNASQLDGARSVHDFSPDNFIVLDTGNQRIQRFNRSSGSGIGTTIMSNLPVSCRNLFVEPTTSTVYVSDMHGHAVLRMPNATIIAGGTGTGSRANQLYYPAGLFVTPTGTLYVADSFNHRVQMSVERIELVRKRTPSVRLGGLQVPLRV